MPSPETQRVEEIIKKLNKVYLRLAYGKSDVETAKKEVDEILTQDRTSIHTNLVAAVEGLPRRRIFKFGTDVLGDEWYVDKEEVLTIINSIFKE